MKRIFVECSQVTITLKRFGVSDEQIHQMENEIMFGNGDIVPKTAGIRKIRCGAQGGGKRGGIRVMLADYPLAGKTCLLSALDKGERENFSQEELAILKTLKKRLDALHRS